MNESVYIANGTDQFRSQYAIILVEKRGTETLAMAEILISFNLFCLHIIAIIH